MAAQNSERLLNLVIALLSTSRYLTRDQIRQLVSGYAAAKTETAFRRMFERDKQDLRSMGVEVSVGPADPATDEADGYRIDPGEFYLPEISLTPQESTLVGLAASVWTEPTVAGEVRGAMTKLRAQGHSVESEPLSYLSPRLTAREPAFPLLWQALLDRCEVRFTYHGSPRLVQGWRLIQRSGAWYLLGENLGRGVRLFRLSRIEDQPQIVSEPRAYTLPAAERIAAEATRLDPPTATASVRLALRAGAAGGLRRRGTHVAPPANQEPPVGFELYDLPYAREDEIVSAICAAGPDVVVVEPGEVRQRVITQLRAVASRGLGLAGPPDGADSQVRPGMADSADRRAA